MVANEGHAGARSGYARSNRFSLRRVSDQGAKPAVQPPQRQSVAATAPVRQPQPQQYRSSKFKLVRRTSAEAPTRQQGSGAAPGLPRGQALARPQQQSQAPTRPQQQSQAPTRPKQLQGPQPPPPQQQQQQQPPTRLPPQSPPQAGPAADGQQQRFLVYSKSKSGRSLQRTGIKAAAAKRRALTWRNPATAAASPPVRRATQAAGGSAAARQATARPSLAPRRAPAATVAATRPARSKYKYVRSATPVAALSASAASRPLQPAAKRPAKWNKYIRVGLRPSSPKPVAAVTRPQPQQRQPSVGGGASSGGRASGGTQSKALRLLRLGSCMYKVVSKGRSRSLLRQRSSPLPSQQEQQALAPRQRHATPRSGKPAGRGAALLKAVPSLKKVTAKKQLHRWHRGAAAAAAAAAAAPQQPQQRQRQRQPTGSSSQRSSLGRSSARIVYCPVYCRTGKCTRRGKGCPYKHDTTKRAVCPRWLHGKCGDAKCLLQHQRKKELMPVCMHFLKGRCTASDCPYLHVNVSASAPVCKAFLRGYCMAGADCPHKHYTLGMVKEERRLASAEQQQRARRARAGGDGARGTEGARVGGKKRSGGRYFDILPPAAKRTRSSSGGEAALGAAVPAALAAGELGAIEQQEEAQGQGASDDFMPDFIPL